MIAPPWSRWLLLGALVLTPLAYGTVHPVPTALFILGGTIGFLGVLLRAYRAGIPLPVLRDPLFRIGGLGVALGILQLIPLPAGVLAVISPGTYRWTVTELADIGIEPWSWHPIAVVPWSAENGTAWLIALWSWYAVAATVLADRRVARTMLRTMAVTGFGLAILGIVQKLTGAQAIFFVGLERPAFYATFVNPNNAATFLLLGALAAAACAWRAHPERRLLWFAAAAFTAGSAVFSLSRGGIAMIPFALLLLAWLRWRNRGAQRETTPAAVAAPLALLAATLFFVLWIGHTEVFGELATLQDDRGLNGRTTIWAEALGRIWPAFPLFGVGYGNFAHVYPAYQAHAAPVTYTALENEYLHALVEGGLAGAALAAAVLWVLLRGLLRPGRRPGDLPLVAGVAAYLVHMLIDFPLHLGAPALWLLTATAFLRREFDSAPAGASGAASAAPALGIPGG